MRVLQCAGLAEWIGQKFSPGKAVAKKELARLHAIVVLLQHKGVAVVWLRVLDRKRRDAYHMVYMFKI